MTATRWELFFRWHGRIPYDSAIAMNPERWRRVEEVYNDVLSCPPEQCLALLEASCSGDVDLRREVESLLRARERAGEFLSPERIYGHIAELGSDAAPSLIGTSLGSYLVEEPIGAGGMGEVYRARDTRLDRSVALKVLSAHLTHDPSRVSRFQLEAKATSALNHTNILTVYEIGQDNGRWFIAAELVQGVTLRDKLSAGKIAVEDVLAIGLQCATALAAAHDAGVVHRDIKPENIMLRPDGVAKVVDFGLARIAEPQRGRTVDATQTGSIMGTPRYMSPEQARGHKSDARSDIFSLGAVLFEMAAGEPAFRGVTTAEVFAALLGSEPDPTRAAPLGYVLSKALAKDPLQRYKSMGEFAAALRSFDPANRPFRWRRIAKPVIAVSLAAVAGIGIDGLMSRTALPQPSLKVVPLATFAGSKSYPSLSPDATRVAFSWLNPGAKTQHIYVKPVDEGDPVQLTSGAHSDVSPAWSPDGKQIAFTRQVQGEDGMVPQDVYLIGSTGGAERKIGVTWRGVSWSPDGKMLALTRVPTEPKSGGVYLLSLASGQFRHLTAGTGDSFPIFSPDGKWVAFKRMFSGKPAQLFVIRAEGGAVKQLTFDPLQPIRAATWTADSREIVFASLRSGVDGSLWRVGISDATPRPVSAILRDASDPNIARAGRLVYREEWIDTNLYLRTAGKSRAGAPATFGAPVPVVDSSREDHSPNFSPDGKRIAFVSERSGHLEIWVARRDGSRAVPLTSMRAQNTGTPRWSPDGTRIAFDSWAAGASAIYVIDANGGTPRALTSGPLGSWMPSWSPDGHWIYFSRGTSGASELWKTPSAGGHPVQLTRSGAFECHASPDGSVIYYSKVSSPTGRSIWSIPSSGGEEKAVAELAAFSNIGRSWGVTKEGIYFVSHEEVPEQKVRFLSFKTRNVTSLFELQKQVRWGIGALAISWDGRYAVAAHLDHEVNNLMMLDNFR